MLVLMAMKCDTGFGRKPWTDAVQKGQVDKTLLLETTRCVLYSENLCNATQHDMALEQGAGAREPQLLLDP
jgi:hypothetical protein